MGTRHLQSRFLFSNSKFDPFESQVLEFNLTPPTLNMWANWHMTQWDSYIDSNPFSGALYPFFQAQETTLIKFKQPNESSYICFREMFQMIDVLLLETDTMLYKPRPIIASLMYIVLGKNSAVFSLETVLEYFPNSSFFLLDETNPFNELFSDFLIRSFKFKLVDLLPTIQFVSKFFSVPVSIELPVAVRVNRENVLEVVSWRVVHVKFWVFGKQGHFEEFLAYQTHCPANLQLIISQSKE